MDRWLAVWLQFLVVIPAAVSCYLVMKNELRYSRRATLLMGCAVLFPFTVLAAFLCTVLQIQDLNVVMLPALLVFFLLYRRTLRCGFAKALAIYAGVCAVQAFPVQFAAYYDAMIHPQQTVADLSPEAALFQLGLSGALCAAFAWPEVRWFGRVVDGVDAPKFWYATVAFSSLFLAGNILAVPQFYSTLRMARMPYLFPLLEALAFAVLAGTYLLFYYGTAVILENSELRETNRLLETQGRQYRILQAHLQQTARLRHDFRHTVRLLAGLTEEGNLDGIQEYLAQYAVDLAEYAPQRFCANPALNALFSYYQAAAAAAEIETDWKIELPDPLPMSEVDLAALFGNLMENAIDACQSVPAGERYFSLVSEVRHGSQLYVVSTNTFNGSVQQQGETFGSTKHAGDGLGLPSVEAIAKKCGGSARTSSCRGEFYVDVMLKI